MFDVLTDPRQHPTIDGSGSVQGEFFGPDKLTGEGQTFGMKMKLHGLPYKIKSTVKEYDENRLIAWAHMGKHRWRYELEPVEGGTKVTETFDWSTAVSPKSIEIMGYPKKHRPNMEATLENLDAHVTGS
ncbi:MAG: SRPBCC family protein [Acidimicrobiales bacterium]